MTNTESLSCGPWHPGRSGRAQWSGALRLLGDSAAAVTAVRADAAGAEGVTLAAAIAAAHAPGRGGTLFHFSPQPEPFSSLKPRNTPSVSHGKCSRRAEEWRSAPLAAGFTVVHAGGVLADDRLGAQRAGGIRAVAAPKVGGATRLLGAGPVAAGAAGPAVLFSSIAAMLGSAGQAGPLTGCLFTITRSWTTWDT